MKEVATMNTLIRPALVIIGLLTVVTGLLYPLAVTGVAVALFPREARGSLVEAGGRVAGSALIGQQFTDSRHLWGRPSATAPFPYNAAAAAGSNLGQSNPALLDAVKARGVALREKHPGEHGRIPVDLVTASGSGLDPDISPAAAAYQVARIAAARGLSTEAVAGVVAGCTAGRQLGVLGEARVNVLCVNVALDEPR